MTDEPLATFSPCGLFRYTLRRSWWTEITVTRHEGEIAPSLVTWLMLNPSTADATKNDPTIRRCIAFSKTWGFDGLTIVNAYAWRSTDPRGLRSSQCSAAGGPVGPENDLAIAKACAGVTVVCGWGRHLLPDRRAALGRLLRGVDLSALATNGDGSPSHPLRLPGSLTPQPFKLEATDA